ncbi:hypothetical protein NM688_g2548 [Phlebia brevispora]|uniref:Uncharacterized protein n=1 Tax=Phlebia brevispora TaxID=194682 RepID=A0ACC1T812_9APHY|nr:hypothetical protein NM688_g2548 [Phlebia brevispora]
MVVTRRAPAPPVPASRTNSAQPIPRVKGKAPHTVPDVPSPLANGTSRAEPIAGTAGQDSSYDDESNVSVKKGKGKQKGKSKKGRESKAHKKTSFVEFLTRIFLLWFTIYTLSVCPNDDKLKSPICRGLHEYRRLVLEPYILPPVQHALSHPAVAPYVDRAKPIVNRAIAVTTPIVVRAHREWTTKVVPQWDRFVVPQWQKHVVPQWKRHVTPHLERAEQQLEPYIVKARTEYEHRLGPHLRVAAYRVYKFQQQARPYVVLAAHKTYDGYERAKPYAVPALQWLQRLLAQVSEFLGEKRRQFVDPHVKRIWERVNELSNGDVAQDAKVRQKVSTTASSVLSSTVVPVSSEAQASSSGSNVPHITPNPALPLTASATSVASSQETVVPTPEVTEALPNIVLSSGVSIASSVVSAAASAASAVSEKVLGSASMVGSAVPSVIMEDAAPEASSAVEDSSLHPASSISVEIGSLASNIDNGASATHAQGSASEHEPIPSSEPTASVVPDQHESSSVTLDSRASDTASQIPVAPSAASSPGTEDTEDDFLAKFYAELGLDQDVLSERQESSESGTASPAAETETEEEKAEKLRLRQEENAKKRTEITARHANWEKQLEDRIANNRKALRKALVASRKAAVQELKENVEIRKEIESLVDEAERYLKGAELYMANLKRENRPDEEKKAVWERVTEKVDKKFEDRLGQTETIVNGWYLKVVEQELQEVRRLAAEVKDISDRAQADIGLDYAWLDDVTYEDWQRYHDLERKSDNFIAQAQAIQDGTHPSPPVNPVLPAIEDLQNEVQDVTVGFETRLRRIKRKGERAFGATSDDNGEVDAPDAPPDETVSILPIETDTPGDRDEAGLPAIPPVVIGRSKDEILSALGRAAENEARATSAPQDKDTQPEQVVAKLAEEAEAERSSSAVFHEEL